MTTFKNMYNNIDNIKEMITKSDIPFVVTMQSDLSQFDVAFSKVSKVNKINDLYGEGIRTQNNSLMISINARSCFCFSLESPKTYYTYVAEKLQLSIGDVQVCKDIADIIEYLKEYINSKPNE